MRQYFRWIRGAFSKSSIPRHASSTLRGRNRRLGFDHLEDRRLLTTFYVDATLGNDANVGTSTTAAWRSLTKVEAAALAPGDNVLFKRGETFADQFDVNRGGTAAAPLTFGAYGTGNDPILLRLRVNGLADYTVFENITIDSNKGNSDAVQVINAHNVTLRNMEVRNGVRDGIDVRDADNLLLDGLHIHHFLAGSFDIQVDAHGIAATQTQGLTIRNTEVHHVSGDSFQADPDRNSSITTNILIENSHFWTGPLDADYVANYSGWPVDWRAGQRPGENAIDTKVSLNAATVATPMQMTVRNVVAHGWAMDGFINNKAVFNMKEKVSAVFDRVTVYDSEIAFRLRGEGSDTRGNADVTIRNAVVYDVLKAIRAEDNLRNLVVQNSTFGDGITSQLEFAGGSGGVSTWDVRNNAYVGNKPAQASHASNQLASSVDFVSAAARNYHLAGVSDLRDAGVAISAVTTDRDGVVRPQGTAYDVGAYEFSSQTALTVAISAASISENGGTTTATVSRSGSTAGSLVVQLASSDTSEATVPATVTISAGQASASFTVTAVNDSAADGKQTVAITASAAGFLAGADTLDVTDDEPAPPFAAYFDFGTASSPLEAGYTRVTGTTTYNTATGYGFTTAVQSIDRGTGTALRRDQAYATDFTYVVDVAPGTYSVTLTSGDALYTTVPTEIYLEGTRVATVAGQGAGQWYTNTFIVSVTDGQLTLRLKGTGGNAKLNSLDVVASSTSAGATRFDFGTASSPVEAGYTRVTGASTFNSTAGFGFTTAVQAVDRGTGTALRRDQAYAADMTFVVNVAPGTYRLTLTSGDTSYSTVPTEIFLESASVATVGTQAAGQWYQNTFTVNVSDGQLTLRLRGTGGNAKINALEIAAASSASLAQYDFGTSTSQLEAGYTRVTHNDLFNSAAGYGWTTAVSSVDRGTSTALQRDQNYAADMTFAIELLPGTYNVSLTSGDASFATVATNIYLEGTQAATVVSQNLGQWYSNTFTVHVSDGQLNVRLQGIGGNAKLNTLTISPV